MSGNLCYGSTWVTRRRETRKAISASAGFRWARTVRQDCTSGEVAVTIEATGSGAEITAACN